MSDLESELGHTFASPGLLRRALTHRSLVAEAVGETSNERLEFLGDSVLGLVIAGALYEAGTMAEGAMAKVRAGVVDEATLAGMAVTIGLGTHLRLGKGEEASGGREKVSILADALEAVIGAVYLDGGIEPAQRFIMSHWEALVTERATAPGEQDYKTRLQELLASTGRVADYRVVGSGPDHARRFTAEVYLDDIRLGSGSGTSKKRAEQEAARRTLDELGGSDA